MKRTMIALHNATLGVVTEYELSHAERILRMANNGGWELADKDKFTFDRTNGTINRRNPRATEKLEETRND